MTIWDDHTTCIKCGNVWKWDIMDWTCPRCGHCPQDEIEELGELIRTSCQKREAEK